MKTIITLASASMLSFGVSAQPVINSNNVSQNFNAELYYAEVPSGFSVGQAGANRVWNFSTLDGMLLGTQAAIPVAGSPFASSFPQANYCYTMNSVFAEETSYFYHRLTATAFEIYSLGFGGEVGEDFHLNPRTYVTFPYTFNTVFTDTYQRSEDPLPVTVTATYDAYGTLIMPFGTFNNVVRQKVVDGGVTNYVWFNVNPFYPILQTALEDDVLGYLIDNTVLDIADQPSKQTLVTYPNPARNVVNIRTPEGFADVAELTVSDMSGKTLISGTFEAANPVVNIDKLSRGVYIVRLTTGRGEFVGKVIKS